MPCKNYGIGCIYMHYMLYRSTIPVYYDIVRLTCAVWYYTSATIQMKLYTSLVQNAGQKVNPLSSAITGTVTLWHPRSESGPTAFTVAFVSLLNQEACWPIGQVSDRLSVTAGQGTQTRTIWQQRQQAPGQAFRSAGARAVTLGVIVLSRSASPCPNFESDTERPDFCHLIECSGLFDSQRMNFDTYQLRRVGGPCHGKAMKIHTL